ncbi:L-type lectin-domain containing receptor kinase IX.1-like [Curcuma longa]|uniref:L-type lectin-domain containing receptor kinase IX.1-like n=1 Tax=Curcuma longa TaxID=136217 RepID=UPI003D9DD25A
MPIIFTLFCLGILVPLATALSFDFLTFDQSSLSKITLEGDASWSRSSSTNGCIQLTRNQQDADMAGSLGRAVYAEPLLLWNNEDDYQLTANFSSNFTFMINPNGQQHPGDGMAFFLSPYPTNSTIPSGFNGWGLGLFDKNLFHPSTENTFSTPNGTVAVEFDTYPNDVVHDPSSAHVGIDVGSPVSVVYRIWEDDGNSSGSSNKWQGEAWVNYDSGTHNLSVFLTLGSHGSLPTTYSLSYIVDLRQVLPSQVAVGFSAATGQSTETHELLSWKFSSTLLQPPPVRSTAPRKSKMGIVVGMVTGVGTLLLLLLLLVFVLLWSKKKKRASRRKIGDNKDQLLDDDLLEIEGRPKRFPYEELATATGSFSDDVKLGEGGFGSVYKGHLEGLNLDVAIKRFAKESSKQGKKEYFSEVNVISRLGHRNLVKLIGWCHDQRELLLVYEFLPNGSLDSYLQYDAQNHLRWPERYKIALDVASAMLYLHHDWEQCVLHRDVKPSNIMLDSAFNAKLGDFGLARLIDHDLSWKTTVNAGTLGYMAPEYLNTGKASKESDVYSFGVVALEIACARRPSTGKLVERAWEFYGKGRVVEAADEKLNGEFDEEQMERVLVVGLWCAHPDFNQRPSMKQAINVLNGQTALPNLSLPPC